MPIQGRALFFVVGGAGLICMGAGGLIYSRHRESTPMSAAAAEVAINSARAPFVGQQPMLDMEARTERADSTNRPSAPAISKYHAVIFDSRAGGRLVRINVPWWFGKRFFAPAGEFKFLRNLTMLDNTEFDSETIRLPLRYIEWRGPGLVVDYRLPSGGQFLAWVD